MISDGMKAWIDVASYEELLRRWRFSPIGDEIFQGKAGEYYACRMARLRDEIGNVAHVAASKRIGWGDPNKGGRCDGR